MRSHSGKDEARNNLHDPTLRDHERARARAAEDVAEPRAKAPADHRQGRKD